MLRSKQYLRFALMAPAGDDTGGGSTGGADGAEDRGDSHVATDELDHDKLKKKVETPAGKVEEEDKGKYDVDDPDAEDETEEEKAEREAAEAKAEREKRIRIPKSRYDEAQAKARAKIQSLEKQIEDLTSANTGKKVRDQVAEFKKAIEDLQDKYEDYVLDGKKVEARTARQQIAQMQDELSEFRANQKSDAARAAAVDQMKFDMALARLEAAHPQLNPDSEQFDESMTDEVADLAESFMARGYQRAEALNRAAKYVMRGSEAATSAKKEPAEDTKEVIEKRRREEARKKAADAAKRQAPDTAGIGKSSDTHGEQGKDNIDVMRMKQKDFAKLDEDTLAKLRGDEVA